MIEQWVADIIDVRTNGDVASKRILKIDRSLKISSSLQEEIMQLMSLYLIDLKAVHIKAKATLQNSTAVKSSKVDIPPGIIRGQVRHSLPATSTSWGTAGILSIIMTALPAKIVKEIVMVPKRMVLILLY